jgi:hypothetical protein
VKPETSGLSRFFLFVVSAGIAGCLSESFGIVDGWTFSLLAVAGFYQNHSLSFVSRLGHSGCPFPSGANIRRKITVTLAGGLLHATPRWEGEAAMIDFRAAKFTKECDKGARADTSQH